MKQYSSSYTTLLGGITSWGEDVNGKRTCFEYTFFYGLFRFGWHNLHLQHGWKHLSLHYNNNKTGHWFNWHMAYNKKWPFIKIGFDNVWPLCEY